MCERGKAAHKCRSAFNSDASSCHAQRYSGGPPQLSQTCVHHRILNACSDAAGNCSSRAGSGLLFCFGNTQVWLSSAAPTSNGAVSVEAVCACCSANLTICHTSTLLRPPAVRQYIDSMQVTRQEATSLLLLHHTLPQFMLMLLFRQMLFVWVGTSCSASASASKVDPCLFTQGTNS